MTVPAWKWYASVGLIAALFAAELFLGSVTLTAADVWLALKGGHPDDVSALIVKRVRLPRAFTALLGGGGLALCGLLMQAFFQNPLAGPGVLGISSGAGLGVAVVVMAGSVGMVAPVSIVAAAFIGAMAVLALILLFSKRMRSPVTLLIFGLMVGYLVSSLVTILQAGSTSEALRSFVFWGMGSFADRSASELYLMTALLVPGAVVAYSLHRQLDLWSLGEDYARTSGLNVGRFRVAVLVVSGLMTAAVTAFCGPIAFIGLAVPHLARGVWQSGRHAVLIPSVVFSGMIVGLACDLIVRLPAGSIPLNAVTSIFGAPVVIALLLKGRRVF